MGFDPKRGFSAQNIPKEWKLIFEKAGITEEQLQDKKTAKFVAKFMKEHAGQEGMPPAAQASPPAPKRAPPPPPSRGTQGRNPPPPPPSRLESTLRLYRTRTSYPNSTSEKRAAASTASKQQWGSKASKFTTTAACTHAADTRTAARTSIEYCKTTTQRKPCANNWTKRFIGRNSKRRRS